jgi:hypothetical protein
MCRNLPPTPTRLETVKRRACFLIALPSNMIANLCLSTLAFNGWTADTSKFVAGLPGAISPLGNFDPIGFCSGKSLSEIKRFREAEVMHCRVAMLGVVGYLVGEAVAPLLGGSFIAPSVITGAANSHLGQQNLFAFTILTIAIGVGELYRALVGWVPPTESAFTMRENYYPGDIGFDPLGLKPKSGVEFKAMQERELSNGRLAMFAVAGFCGQEVVNGKAILANLLG